jgi:hypothetical protein
MHSKVICSVSYSLTISPYTLSLQKKALTDDLLCGRCKSKVLIEVLIFLRSWISFTRSVASLASVDEKQVLPLESTWKRLLLKHGTKGFSSGSSLLPEAGA